MKKALDKRFLLCYTTQAIVAREGFRTAKSFCDDTVRHRGIAQLVEQRSPKPRAVGSSPTSPATYFFFYGKESRAKRKDNAVGFDGNSI